MVTRMKTTIEIADDLLARARQEGRREQKTLREIVDEALRQRLSTRARPAFRLRRHSFTGQGPTVAEGHWETVRDLIYRLG